MKINHFRTIRTPKTKNTKPVTTVWNGERIIRQHSLRRCVGMIVDEATTSDFVSMSLIGPSGRGKTTLAETIGHLFHELMAKHHKINYVVHYWGKEELADFQAARDSIKTNAFVLFDDISFMQKILTSREMAKIQQGITEVRHRPDGKDLRIVLAYNFHYSKALDKFLRGTDYTWFVSMSSSEIANYEGIIGKRNMARAHAFEERRRIGMRTKKWEYKYAKHKPPFVYKFRDPFAPALFWDGDRLAEVVYPRRQWLAPNCTVCNHAGDKVESAIDVKAKLDELAMVHGRGHVQGVLKLWLQNHGVNTYGKTTVTVFNKIERMTKHAKVSYEDAVSWLESDGS